MEESHQPYVSVVYRLDKPLLYHSGTGEVVPIDAAAHGPVDLRFTADGIGYIERDPPIEVSTIFKKLLCRAIHPVSKDMEPFVYDGEASEWRRDIIARVTPRAVRLPATGDRAVQVSVFGVAVGNPHKARVHLGFSDIFSAVF